MYQYQQFAILLRGGGDIATGIALRLYRSGFRRLIILETAHPMAVRRRVAFSEAVYEGLCTVEGITAALAPRPEEIAPLWDAGCIPVMVDRSGYLSRQGAHRCRRYAERAHEPNRPMGS